jgi:NodT family efflux transporter outer membrane factor (OMF) lipoprotein
VRQAEALVEQAGAAGKPQVALQGSAQASERRFSADLPAPLAGLTRRDGQTQASAAVQLDLQLDFFGRNRASVAAATSSADAARAEEASARLQLSTAVASAYADLARLVADRAAAETVLRLRRESAALVRQREASGVEGQASALQADAELAQARADLAAAEGSVMRARNQLAVLLGKGPDRGLEIAEPRRPVLAPPGLPERLAIDLVGRRPDLAAARLRAEAAAARIDVARADFYPNVSLTALASFQTLGLSSLGGGELTRGAIGPAVSLPIFSGGRLEGAYRGARAEYDEAVAVYDQTLVAALGETADVIADRRALDAQLAEMRSALAASEAAYALARQRYQGGLASYIDTLSVENGLVARRRALASLETRAFALDVALVRALGGGFRTT